jgi:SAM-dependent methyltransferase
MTGRTHGSPDHALDQTEDSSCVTRGVYTWLIMPAFALLRPRAKHRYHVLGRLFDEENNVQTSGQTLLSELTVAEASTDESMWYEPAPPNVVPDILRNLGNRYENFTFVDLGSGRGRVVLLASHFGFKKVVGIEFAEELHQQALENLRHYPRDKQKCQNVEFVCSDVRQYVFPETDLILFIYDSFKAELLRSTIAKLKRSYLAHPRKIYLVYLNPGQRNQPKPIIERSGFLHKKNLFSFIGWIKFYRNSPSQVVVYETK